HYALANSLDATGAVSGDNEVGGLVGSSAGALVNVYASGAVLGSFSGSPSATYIGGLVGNVNGSVSITDGYYVSNSTGMPHGIQADGSEGLSLTELAMALPSGFDPSVWGNVGNQTTPYLLALTNNPQPVFLLNDGTPFPYSLLFNLDQVQDINNDLGGHYALANSLDATGVTWTPIGTSATHFSGIFDGLNNTISNLTITTTNSYVGLFGYSAGTIRNVGVVGGSINGMGNSHYDGDLVGWNSGAIVNSWATGAVTGNIDVGGLVGWNAGTINNSYATGAVTAHSSNAGGLVGQNSGTISSSFAMGAVSSSGAGGLVGYNNGGAISDSYATGVVTGGSLGGLVGLNDGTVTDSYWDTQTSGVSTSDGGIGLTTAELQTGLPFGFDHTVWGSATGLYPYFLWQYPTTPEAVTGIAYGDSGVTPLRGGSVTALVDGVSLGSASTGANGYYYLLAPSGTISYGGSAVLAYTGNGARLDTRMGTTSQFDIWGDNTLIAPTRAFYYSDASATPLQTQDAALLAQAVGTNPDPTAG
ncbi:MAG TPA: GLUG motif-containing protein, partial [Candidatus Saccharimonadales bacterium]|nr:GLUG motif-containing protein [Candidatus Saccharimonadales bacterium]